MGWFLIPFFLFLPGYAFTFFFRWIHGFFERIAFSIILSISSGVIISFFYAIYKIPLVYSFLFFFILCVACFFFWRKKTHTLFLEWSALLQKEKWFFVLFLVLSILAGVFIAIPHFHDPWPIHGDEWWYVGTVQNVIEGKSLNTHPYLFDEFTNNKPGFSSYIAMLFGFGKIDPIRGWTFLPAINVFLISLIGSLLLYAITKKTLLAGIFPILLVALRSNAYVLGWWFFVPSTFGLLFVLAVFLSVSFWKKTFSGFIFAFILFTALFLVYAPLGLFSLIIILPFLIPYQSIFAYARQHVLSFLIISSACIAIVASGIYIVTAISPYRVYWTINSFWQPAIIQAFFVPRTATIHFSLGSEFFDTVPLLLLFAAIMGCMRIIKEPWKQIICFGMFIGILNVLLVYIFDISFLLFHQRNFYMVGLFAVILASSGVSLLFDTLQKYRYSKYIFLPWKEKSVGIFFLLCLCFILFLGYFTLTNGTLLYHLVEKEDLAAMHWLVKHRSELGDKMIIANQAVGTLITPFTRMRSKISFLTTQNVAGIINPQDILAAEEPDCRKKETALIRLKGDIVYAKSPQSCSFLKEIYHSQRVFIYLYTPTS